MKRIQFALEKTKAADKIQEDPWLDVVLRELNEISKDCAKELQTETGQIGNKGDYQLGLDDLPDGLYTNREKNSFCGVLKVWNNKNNKKQLVL